MSHERHGLSNYCQPTVCQQLVQINNEENTKALYFGFLWAVTGGLKRKIAYNDKRIGPMIHPLVGDKMQ